MERLRRPRPWIGLPPTRTALVEEWDDRGGERRIAAHRVVAHARQDRESRGRPAGAIPPAVLLAAAEEPEHFHGMRGREHVGVAGDDHRRHLYLRQLFRIVEVALHRLADLAE